MRTVHMQATEDRPHPSLHDALNERRVFKALLNSPSICPGHKRTLMQCVHMQATEDRPHPSLQDGLKERTSIKAILESPDEGVSLVGKSLCVAGWVKTGRQQGSGAYEPWAFLELNDGSTLANLQVRRPSIHSESLRCLKE